MQKQDHKQFVGVFKRDNYTVKKCFIDTENPRISLYHVKYTPQNAKNTICLIHGFGQHIGRYQTVAQFFVSHDFQVIGIDMRDFGCSGSGTAAMTTIRDYQNDIIRVLRQARQDLPLFLYGHSMGGLIVCKLLLDRPKINVSGCVLTSPCLGFENSLLTPAKAKMIKILGGILGNNLTPAEVPHTKLYKDQKNLDKYIFDPLLVKYISLRTAKSLIQETQQVRKRSGQFKTPIMIFHGKQDMVVSCEVSRKFVYDKVTPFKNLFIFENGYHELQHDQEKDALFEKSLKFIMQISNKIPFQGSSLDLIDLPTPNKSKKIIIMSFVFFLIWLLNKLRN